MPSTHEEEITPSGFRGKLLSHVGNSLRGSGRLLGAAILALVAFIGLRAVLSEGGYLNFDPTVLFAVALVGAGVLLLRGQEPVVGTGEVAVRRPTSPLGILTLSAAFLVVGAVMLLGNLDVTDVGIGQMIAAALVIVGAGLLIGAWWGRSRLLILIGFVLVPAVVIGGFLNFPLRGSLGYQDVYPASIEDLADEYRVLYGDIHMDLLNVEDWTGTRSVDFEVAAGQVTIFVPERVSLSVTGHMEWGNATIGKGREEGEDLRFANEIEGSSGAGHLDINFEGGIASLYIERISKEERFGPSPDRSDEPDKDSLKGRDGQRSKDNGREKDNERRRHDRGKA